MYKSPVIEVIEVETVRRALIPAAVGTARKGIMGLPGGGDTERKNLLGKKKMDWSVYSKW